MNVLHADIRKGRKYEQVLTGARQVFLADGFEGASVDAIARAAGVSKATIYSYFPDKRALFTEVARAECKRQSERATASIDMDAQAAEVLRAAATHMTEFVISEFGQQMFRICAGESDRFPELGREFYNSGPKMVRDTLVDYFKLAIEKGELEIEDMDLAAHQFSELCKAVLYPRIIFGVQTEFTRSEVDRVAKGAAEMFMARYGT